MKEDKFVEEALSAAKEILRLVIGNIETIPGKFFTHNEALDFCVAAAAYKKGRLHELFASLLRQEVEASRKLEHIMFERKAVHIFREEIQFESGGSQIT